MTPECIETIRRMAEQGKSGKEVARAVNYSLKYVYNVCAKNGIKIPRRTARWKVTDKETGKVYIGTMKELEKQVYVSRSTLYVYHRKGGRYIVRRIG